MYTILWECSHALNVCLNVQLLPGDHPLCLDLPDVEVLARLVLPLTLALVHLVQLQHGLTGLSECNDQLAHAARLDEALCKTSLVVGNIVCQLHTPQEMFTADHVSARAKDCVVCQHNLGKIPIANLDQVGGLVFCFQVS